MSAPPPSAATPARRPVVLVADDSEDMRNLFGIMLKPKYDLKFAANGEQTLQQADIEPLPDLILLDVEMPDLDGYQVCAQLKANPALADIPVIFVTGRADAKDQARGLLSGAVDYILKPISAPLTLLRVRTQLALVDQRRALEERIRERTDELEETRLELIRRLARAMEYREGGLTNRVLRVSEYVAILARTLGMNENTCEALAQAAPLYDVGKLGVPEHILRKTDALNEREWEEMRQHPAIGAKIIGEHRNPLLGAARTMALTHHERWDGTGYPARLKEEAIPVPGRIMALADAYEAMTATQRYRSPLPHRDAVARIAAQHGKQFDPRIVAAFEQAALQFDEARRRFRDELEGIHDLDFAIAAKPKSS